MLIELSEDLRGRLRDQPADEVLVAALRNLALGYREGNHVITGSRSLLQELVELPLLPVADRDTYRQIKLRLQDSQTLGERIACRVSVGTGPGCSTEDQSGVIHFRVGYTFFARSARIQTAELIGESFHDAEVYHRAAESYAAQQGWKINVQLRCIGGGGSGETERHLRNSARQHMTLCIVDSDVDWPEGAPGATAKEVLEAVRELAGQCVVHAHLLPVRMIENLFPRRLVEAAFASKANDNQRKVLTALCSALQQHGELGTPALRFLKLKSNLLLSVELNEKDANRRAYFREFRSKLMVEPPTPRAEWCQDHCLEQEAKKCRCVLLHGINMLKPVHSYIMNDGALADLAEHIFSPQRGFSPDPWIAIASLVASWGCAVQPPRV